MSSTFRTAAKASVSRETRIDAIDRLAEEGDTTNLRLLVQLDGLRGGLRRHALERLASTGAGAELARLATDRTLPDSLRAEAQRRVSS